MDNAEEYSQHAQARHNESMSVVRNGNVYDVELITITNIDNLHLNDPAKRRWAAPLHPMDAFLISVVEKYNLQSLVMSVSSSSTNQRRGFPVGTAVQYHTKSKNSTSGHRSLNEMDQKDDQAMEYDLMRILSQKNMLCETAQLEPLYSNGKLRATPLGDGSKIIIIPNDAYSLCHSKAVYDQVISAAPCRDTCGIYSQIQKNLNSIDILNKSSWIDLKVLENGQIQIQRGLRFGRIIIKMNDEPISSAELLGGNGDFLHSCPLANSSTIVVHEKSGIMTYDFRIRPLDMRKGFQIKDEEKNNLHIQRSNVRLNGIANKGKLITRVYVGRKKKENSLCKADNVDVHVVETYPSFISPIYHSLNLLLVQGPGAGDENFALATATSKKSNFIITQLSLKDIKHALNLHSDGSGTMTFVLTNMQQDSSLYIQLDYDPKYLGFESFSSDPNRGFDLIPSIATFSCNSNGMSLSTSYFSNSLIIMPPVPDLSMPYNVISLFSTFCALIIGTIINITIKKSREKVRDQLNGKVSKSKKEAIKEKMRRLLSILGVKSSHATCSDDGTSKEKSD